MQPSGTWPAPRRSPVASRRHCSPGSAPARDRWWTCHSSQLLRPLERRSLHITALRGHGDAQDALGALRDGYAQPDRRFVPNLRRSARADWSMLAVRPLLGAPVRSARAVRPGRRPPIRRCRSPGTEQGCLHHRARHGVCEAIAGRRCVALLDMQEGPWSIHRKPLEVFDDTQVAANGYLQPVTAGDGSTFHLVANPVQFDESPPHLTRAPEHGEHTEAVLLEEGSHLGRPDRHGRTSCGHLVRGESWTSRWSPEQQAVREAFANSVRQGGDARAECG